MPTLNLTSIEDAAAQLSDRTITDMVADELRRCIATATSLIAAKLGTEFNSGVKVKVFDINPGFTDTPGAFSTPFTNDYRPRFSLPVTGAVTGLVVKYRGSYTLDEEFDWAEVEPLVLYRDYLYREETGEVELLFAPTGMVHGLYTSYQQGYTAVPDILVGSRNTNLLMQLGLDTELAPLPALFTGVPHPLAKDAATTEGTAPGLASIVVAPPQAIATHRVRVHMAQDAALVSAGTATLRLRAGPEGSETTLTTLSLATPAPGQSYVLDADPNTDYSRYVVEVEGSEDATVTIGLVEFEFVDADTLHMLGSAPEPLTTACAMQAAYLYTKQQRDGTGKQADTSGRTYTNYAMPPEVLALLAPYKRGRVSFV